ncbi:isoprenylcysteine carboxylmethyltransferase family protein [archaeon]|nr:isoprenylcysteine carboxylmethyltransferase family protein [archaeon]
MNEDFILAFLICFITYVIHTESHYSSRKERKPWIPENRIGLFVAIGYFAWFYMMFSDPFKAVPDLITVVISLAVGIIGLFMIIFSAKAKKGFSDANKLATTGIYSKIRNPMYLGMILVYLGFPLAAGSLLTLASVLIWTPIMFMWINWEEKDLTKQFGKEYLEYKKKTLF